MSAANSPSRWKDPRGPYIRLYDGFKWFLLHPKAEDFSLDRISHHMARISRYTGASTYTNGQHSVVAAQMANRFYPNARLLPAKMLIHDVAESVLNDVSSPLKSLLPDYRALETLHDAAVEERFDLTFLDDPLVKEVDDRMWLTERLVVYPMLSREDDYTGPLEEFPLTEDELMDDFTPWAVEVVEHELRIAFAQLLPWIAK